jgi:hypothetical protein
MDLLRTFCMVPGMLVFIGFDTAYALGLKKNTADKKQILFII